MAVPIGDLEDVDLVKLDAMFSIQIAYKVQFQFLHGTTFALIGILGILGVHRLLGIPQTTRRAALALTGGGARTSLALALSEAGAPLSTLSALSFALGIDVSWYIVLRREAKGGISKIKTKTNPNRICLLAVGFIRSETNKHVPWCTH